MNTNKQKGFIPIIVPIIILVVGLVGLYSYSKLSNTQIFGALPLMRTEQGGTGKNSSAWTGVVYTSSGVWQATSTLSLDNLTVNDVFTLSGQVDPGPLVIATTTAPTIRFATDTDTGIGTITDDTITLMTGGQHRLFVDTNGNIAIGTTTTSGIFTIGTSSDPIFSVTTEGKVGIGTTGPGAKLHIIGTADAAATGDATYPGTIKITDYTVAGPQATGGLEFKDSSSNNGYGTKLYTNASGNYFGIANRLNSATWAEHFVIDQQYGYVGIGTSTISGLFTVGSTTDPIFNITTQGYVGIGVTNPQTYLQIGPNTLSSKHDVGMWVVPTLTGGNGNYDIGLGIHPSQTGDTGTGQTIALDVTPGYEVDTTDAAGIRLYPYHNGNVTTWTGINITSGGGAGLITNKYALITDGDAGNVGIGTSTPSAILHAYTSATTTAILEQTGPNSILQAINATGTVFTIDNAGNLTAGSGFYLEQTTGYLAVGTTTLSGVFTVGTTSDVMLNVTTEGNVGIGTTNPGAYKLNVNGTANFADDVSVALNKHLYISDIWAQSNSVDLTLQGGNAANIVFSPQGTGSTVANTDADSNFRVGTNQLFVQGSNGNVGIGTTTPSNILTIAKQSATSTVSIGDSTSAACLKLMDTDLGGWSWCSILDGVLSCSQTSCE